MVDISKLKVGDKVHYLPSPFSECENGIVKETPDFTNTQVRVVYHCNSDWDNFMNYPSQLTPISKLYNGWDNNSQNENI